MASTGISRAFHAINMGVGPLMAAQFYMDQRAKGRSVIGSTAMAGLETWAFTAFQWPVVAFQLAPLIDGGLQMLNRQTGNMQRNITPNSAFGLQDDSQAAATSRGRAVKAIMDSRLNARSALGAEAGLFSARYR